jgi:NTP pyrophosphatase (non-canonical NTP hydrolase)
MYKAADEPPTQRPQVPSQLWCRVFGAGDMWHLPKGEDASFLWGACGQHLGPRVAMMEFDPLVVPDNACSVCVARSGWPGMVLGETEPGASLTFADAIARVHKWHTGTLPAATLEGAMLHAGEEIIELDRALHDWRAAEMKVLRARDLAEEVVDVLIVLLAIAGEAELDIDRVFTEKMTVNETSDWIEMSPGRYRRVKDRR